MRLDAWRWAQGNGSGNESLLLGRDIGTRFAGMSVGGGWSNDLAWPEILALGSLDRASLLEEHSKMLDLVQMPFQRRAAESCNAGRGECVRPWHPYAR